MLAQIFRLLMACTLISSLLHCPAQADTPDSSLIDPAPATNVAPPFAAVPLANGPLATLRGGSDISVSNDSRLAGMVGQNQAYDLITGNNNITEGSLAGASGFSTVIQNSGNNVLIQNSTIINLQVK